MKPHIDKEADALYLRLDDSKIVELDNVSPVSMCALTLKTNVLELKAV